MLYVVGLLVALLLGGAAWLKHEIASNGQLKSEKTQLESVLHDTQEAVHFQQMLNLSGQQRAAAADAKVLANAREADKWRTEYAKLFSGSDDAARNWGVAPLPRSVAFSLCRNDGNTDAECARQMAAATERRVPGAAPAKSIRGGDEGPGRGDAKAARSAQELQRPTR